LIAFVAVSALTTRIIAGTFTRTAKKAAVTEAREASGKELKNCLNFATTIRNSLYANLSGNCCPWKFLNRFCCTALLHLLLM
jgi:hypothetical protein